VEVAVKMVYPALVDFTDDGQVALTFPDFASAEVVALDEIEAIALAEDALVAAVDGLMWAEEPIPYPGNAQQGMLAVALPVEAAAKIAIYQTAAEQRKSVTEFAESLGMSRDAFRQLTDLTSPISLSNLETTLALVGKRIIADIDSNGTGEMQVGDDDPIIVRPFE
jgi:antitoxin HicB